MVYKCVFVLLLFLFDVILCINVGDPCKFNNSAGICKSINDCPVARIILYEDEKKPPASSSLLDCHKKGVQCWIEAGVTTCKWDGDVRIVCCPTGNAFHGTGVFRDYFVDSNNGIKRSKDMTCRYNGVQPVLCCPKTREAEPAREPNPCPKLNRPRINTDKLHLKAWERCLDYQQYFNKCVNKVGKPNEYKRVNTCGREEILRIAGGSEANPREFPHMAVLGCRNAVTTEADDVVWIGGGSLISEKYILTAAHVLISPMHGAIKYALLGTVNKSDTQNGALYNIARRVPYPNYEHSSLNYDIALVELETRVRFTEFIRPACLPVLGREIESDRIIAGWGETGSRARSELLLTAQLTEDTSLCSKKFEGKNFAWMDDAMICAVGNKSTTKLHHADSCKGDSGGPLMALMKNIPCSYSIEGIVSRGPTYCGQGHPGIYTRVTHYLSWILENVWPEFEVKENGFEIAEANRVSELSISGKLISSLD